MKRPMLMGAAVICAAMLTGCATSYPIGSLYTGVEVPVTATASPGAKQGVAECKSYLTLVAIGDCSIEAAKKNGGISKVSSVDWQATNILGIIGTYQVRVTGE